MRLAKALRLAARLERRAVTQTRIEEAQAALLSRGRRDVIEGAARARRAIEHRRAWAAFACAALHGHTTWRAGIARILAQEADSAALRARQFRNQALRWAKVRRGLERRWARAEPGSCRWAE